MRKGLRAAAVAAAMLGSAGEAGAWPSSVLESLARDARRLLPRSLALLMQHHEQEILEHSQRFPPELAQLMAADLSGGRLQPETVAALELHAAEPVSLLRQRRITEGVVRLGALLRIPADLSDPVLTAGPPGYSAGVTREYYAFVEASLPKIPVVLDDATALQMRRERLGAYWAGLFGRSRGWSEVIQIEMFRQGRVVDHRSLDYRSPVFGVASLAYSRAVTSIAATWLAVWRSVGGDLTLMPVPDQIRPLEPYLAVPRPQAPAPSPANPSPPS